MTALNKCVDFFEKIRFEKIFGRFGCHVFCQFEFLMGRIEFVICAFFKISVVHLLNVFKDEWGIFFYGDEVFFKRPKWPSFLCIERGIDKNCVYNERWFVVLNGFKVMFEVGCARFDKFGRRGQGFAKIGEQFCDRGAKANGCATKFGITVLSGPREQVGKEHLGQATLRCERCQGVQGDSLCEQLWLALGHSYKVILRDSLSGKD